MSTSGFLLGFTALTLCTACSISLALDTASLVSFVSALTFFGLADVRLVAQFGLFNSLFRFFLRTAP